MPCVCQKLCCGERTVHNYSFRLGFKRCKVCEKYIKTDTNRCFCCNQKLSLGPHNNHPRKIFNSLTQNEIDKIKKELLQKIGCSFCGQLYRVMGIKTHLAVHTKLIYSRDVYDLNNKKSSFLNKIIMRVGN